MYFLSLIPILVAFVMIMKTKRAFESCIMGILSAMVIYAFESGEWNLPVMFYNFLADTCSDPSYMWVIIFTLFVGVVTQVLYDSGATRSFTNWVTSKYASDSKRSLFSIIVLSIIVYADEFLKAAVLNSYGRTIGKKNRLPVETVGILIISLCIPLVSWIPMATWSVYFVQLMEGAGITSNGTLDFVTKVLPFFIYPIILFVLIVLFSAGVLPGFGTVKEAMQKVKDGTYDFSVYGIRDEELTEDLKAKPINFVVPLLILLGFGIYYNGDLAVACIIVTFIELIWFVARRIMTFSEFMDSFWKGMISMFKPTVYLMVGYALTTVVELIGFPEMVQSVASILVPGAVLAFFFVAATAIGTLTGIFWPVTSLFITSCLPITDALGISPFVLCAVIFSAATFGTTISPRGALVMYIGEELNSNPVDLMKSERPYALIAGGVTLAVYLVLGFILV